MKLLYIIPFVFGLCACDKTPIYTSNKMDCAGEKVNVKIYKDYVVAHQGNKKFKFDLVKRLYGLGAENLVGTNTKAANVYGENAELVAFTDSLGKSISFIYNEHQCWSDAEPYNPKHTTKLQSKTKYIGEELVNQLFDFIDVKSVSDIPFDVDGIESRTFDTNAQAKCGVYNDIYKINGNNGWLQLLDDTKPCENAKLKDGEWAVSFPYGTVKGESLCSAKDGDKQNFKYDETQESLWATSGYVLEDMVRGEKKYCWCKSSGLYDSVSDTNPRFELGLNDKWVFVIKEEDANICSERCAGYCATAALWYQDFRRASYIGFDFPVIANIDIEEIDSRIEEKSVEKDDKRIDVGTMYFEKDGVSISRVRAGSCYMHIENQGTKIYDADSCFGLNDGDWDVVFEDGIIAGTYKCANNQEEKYSIGTPDGDDGRYCWCGLRGIIIPSSGKVITAQDSELPYAFYYDTGSASKCKQTCSITCSSSLRSRISSARNIVYGSLGKTTQNITENINNMNASYTVNNGGDGVKEMTDAMKDMANGLTEAMKIMVDGLKNMDNQ